jgi:hypothetical protein
MEFVAVSWRKCSWCFSREVENPLALRRTHCEASVAGFSMGKDKKKSKERKEGAEGEDGEVKQEAAARSAVSVRILKEDANVSGCALACFADAPPPEDLLEKGADPYVFQCQQSGKNGARTLTGEKVLSHAQPARGSLACEHFD